MRYLILLTIIFGSIAASGQDSLVGVTYDVDTLNKRDENNKKHGWWVHTYSKDRLKSTIYYIHGKKERYAHYYFKDGRLKETGQWCDNLKDGWWTYWKKNKPEKTERVLYNSKKVVEVIEVWDYSQKE